MLHPTPHPSHPWWLQWRTHWNRWRDEGRQVRAAALAVNMGRVSVGAVLVALINMSYVAIYFMKRHGFDAAEHAWALEVLGMHLSMLGPMLLGAFLGFRWRNPPSHLAAASLPWVMAGLTLAFSVGFALIDMAIVPSVSAYINGCMGVALVYLLRPLQAWLLYAGGAAMMLTGLARLPADNQAVVLSNQVNVVTSSLLALVVSHLLWRTFTRNELLQRQLSATNETLQHKQVQLERLAAHDPLTGLLNRRAFRERVRRELRLSAREATPVSVLMLDLDRFKLINDQWGHPAGDAVLTQAAHLLTQHLRTTDLVGRWGGEEFIVLLPHTDRQQAGLLAEKLRLAQAQAETDWEGQTLKITASYGVATREPGSTADLDDLVALADQALYDAKHQGRNQVVQATSALDAAPAQAPVEAAAPPAVTALSTV